MGRYSIAAADPFLILKSQGSKVEIIRRDGGVSLKKNADPFSELKKLLYENAVLGGHATPPFAGGAIGYAGYEAKSWIEPRLSKKTSGNLGLPDLFFMFFDQGVIFDHQAEEIVLFASNVFRSSAAVAYQKTRESLNALEKKITGSQTHPTTNGERSRTTLTTKSRTTIKSSLGPSAFMKAVRAAKRYIKKGDIYQANLSQRFEFPLKEDPLGVYHRLKNINPSSFFAYLDAGDFQIISGSPERLVSLKESVLETRPIAGTRGRGRDSQQDARFSRGLLLSPKERAEHIMLVDLERNDLGRVAAYGTVRVDELMVLEDYSHVKHIVSNIRGRLKKGVGAVDAFKAFFPGGTITGAPKIRSMEIIDELEPVTRGPYTGSLGYFSFTGNMDFNIIIRSLVIKNHMGYLHTGSGIVADSIPRKEYEETLYKAEAVFQAVFGPK